MVLTLVHHFNANHTVSINYQPLDFGVGENSQILAAQVGGDVRVKERLAASTADP